MAPRASNGTLVWIAVLVGVLIAGVAAVGYLVYAGRQAVSEPRGVNLDINIPRPPNIPPDAPKLPDAPIPQPK
ncbi:MULTISPECIES: hypothetical protein [Phenylobacterium]|uniref:Flagellar basal body-associated protein FliL n=1 Tax=Phenylobacterium koreense TaxID=266125 RepID=A0ABV2EDN3_9CAUL